jgi:tRNA threonylcarbamoyladenosine biosynthesis protein TsaB
MIVLGVDTTTSDASVAVVRDGDILEERLLSGEAHPSTTLLPEVERLLDGLGIAPRQLDGFAVTTGPGSFTGLRVGLSTVQGMALASSRPCLGIPALDVLAARIVGAAEVLVAVMDAYRGEVFGAIYDRQASLRSRRTVGSVENLLRDLSGGPAFVGGAVGTHREQILARLPEARFPEASGCLAGTLARLAEPRLRAGEGVEPSALRPLYIREAEIGKRRR